MKNILINASVPAVERLYLKRDWQTIIKSRKGIRIPSSNPLDLNNYVHDQPDSVWEIMARDQVQVFDNSPFLDELYSNPKSSYEKPCDLYVLDSETRRLLNRYHWGAISISDKNLSAVPLKTHWEYPLRRNEPFSWKQFFREDVLNTKLVSNSLIILDKYLFTDFEEGLNNFLDIIDAILPKKFYGCYHVLLVSDENKVMKSQQHESLAEAIYLVNSYFPSLRRPYEVLFEALLVHPLGQLEEGQTRSREEKALKSFYKDIHDRQIITNSFCASASHALSVTCDQNGKQVSAYKQKLFFDAIYSGIDNRYQRKDNLPYKECEDSISSLRKFIYSANPICRFFSNGIERQDVSGMQNRLLKIGLDL